MKRKFSLIGLILNLIGTIMLAFSVSIVNPCTTFGACMTYGKIVQNAPFVNLFLFEGGLFIIFIGFVFQLIGLFKDKNK